MQYRHRATALIWVFLFVFTSFPAQVLGETPASVSKEVKTLSVKPTDTTTTLSATEILSRMDGNMTFGTKWSRTIMEIHEGSDVRSKTLVSWGKGIDTAFVLFEAPSRDKGTKYLKRGGRLWVYLPSAEKVIRISGHMLRRSMMGSDFSYEDFLDAPELTKDYNAKLLGQEEIEGRLTWVLELTARIKRVTYPRRKVWIDVENYAPRRTELFARGGRLVKRQRFSEDRKFGDRVYPTRIEMENLLRRGTRTVIRLVDLKFDPKMPRGIFSQAQLRRGN